MVMYTDCQGCHGTLGQDGCPKHSQAIGPFRAAIYIPAQQPAQQGWICPLCGTVNAPWMPTCCKKPDVIDGVK